jgi:hypothetical protein
VLAPTGSFYFGTLAEPAHIDPHIRPATMPPTPIGETVPVATMPSSGDSAMLPKTTTALDEEIRKAQTAGELAAMEPMFDAFVRKGSRVASIRILGHPRQGQIGFVYKDFLSWEKDPARKRMLLLLRYAICLAKPMPAETPIGSNFWTTLADINVSP